MPKFPIFDIILEGEYALSAALPLSTSSVVVPPVSLHIGTCNDAMM